MNIKLYKTASEPKRVNKTLTDEIIKSGKLHTPTSMKNPVIILSLDDDLFDYNYMYIPAFNRYYFLGATEIIDGDKMKITGSVDVLQTYWDELKTQPIHVVRTQDAEKANFYLPDNKVVITPRYHIHTKTTPNYPITKVLPGDTGYSNSYTFVLNTM